MKKTISWIPGYKNENWASTRIRVFYIHNAINNLHEKEYKSIIGCQKDVDILIIQKFIGSRGRAIRDCTGFKIYDVNKNINIPTNIACSNITL